MSKSVTQCNTAKVVKSCKSRDPYAVFLDISSEMHAPRVSLLDRIKTQSHIFGLGYDETTQLAEWITDSEPEDDLDDSWQNIRPY
ncbi:hypothetical protein UFOVP273_27 [uncultured Caudovirales phage]|uniref:Uncharacterized protein n=1 Tax=uncultured Caudovirales phage TaxID=2100421 RepID=A0A6J5LL53_9CAUD|nr:hypothetical protein UFOVP273_27 [uncultured Caudovirales phage]